MSDLYLRQQTPQTDRHSYDILIMGCGGVGACTAQMLVMSGMINSLYLVDGDEYELHNLNRIPLSIDNAVGKKKTEALRVHLKELRPEVPIATYPDYLTVEDEHRIDIPLDYIVMAADGENAHRVTEEVFGQYIDRRKVIFAGTEQDEADVRLDPIKWHGDADSAYDDVWVGSTMGTALTITQIIKMGMHDFRMRILGRHGYHSNDQSTLSVPLDPTKTAQINRQKERVQDQFENLQEQYESLHSQSSGFKGQMRRLQNMYSDAQDRHDYIKDTIIQAIREDKIDIEEVVEEAEALQGTWTRQRGQENEEYSGTWSQERSEEEGDETGPDGDQSMVKLLASLAEYKEEEGVVIESDNNSFELPLSREKFHNIFPVEEAKL